MGTLKTGATYIYEKANGVTYAREFGADANTREAIGWEANKVDTVFGIPVDILAEWVAITNAAKTNPALQDALNSVKMLYELTKNRDEDNPTP